MCPAAKAINQMCKDWTSQRCGEICICFVGSYFLFLKCKIYNLFLVVSSTAEVKINTWNDHQVMLTVLLLLFCQAFKT